MRRPWVDDFDFGGGMTTFRSSFVGLVTLVAASLIEQVGAARAAGSESAAPAATTAAPAVVSQKPQVDRSRDNDDQWTAKDFASLGGLLGAIVAALAIWSNGRSSRATVVQKANEKELESMQSKLDDFYGPYLQLSRTNYLIVTDLKSRLSCLEQARTLLLLVDPSWKEKFSKGDQALIEEILALDSKLLDLIQDKSGLVSEKVQPYFWRAAAHFRMMKLAYEGKLENEPGRYSKYVYPKQLDRIVDLEIGRLKERMELIRANPMILHPPTADLTIPTDLKLEAWT